MDISVRDTGPLIVEDRSWLGDVDGTQATKSITLATSLFTKATHYPDGVLKSGTVLAKVTAAGATLGMFGPYAGGTNEVQTVTITGSPTGGTVTLALDGETTAAIAYNANAAAVQAALEALSNVDAGDVTVTGGPGPGTPWVVTFGGQYAGTNMPQMTASGASLTGGSSPAIAVTTTTAGGAAAATAGLEIAKGFLFNSVRMTEGGANLGAPLQERGVIRPWLLPTNHGLDARARGQLRPHFIFRDE